MPTDTDVTRQLLDRFEINDLMARYATMVDTRAWSLHDQVFSPDAFADYTSTGGPAGPAKDVMTWLDRALVPWPLNLHVIANLAVEFQGPDRATARCYFYAPMGRPDGDAQFFITNGGSYDDELVRTSDGWRLASRICRMTMMDGRLPEGYVIPD